LFIESCPKYDLFFCRMSGGVPRSTNDAPHAPGLSKKSNLPPAWQPTAVLLRRTTKSSF
jgi:hypothetical protein